MARNLGLVMRRLFGIGTARSLQAAGDLADSLYFAWFAIQSALAKQIAPAICASQKTPTQPKPNFTFALAA